MSTELNPSANPRQRLLWTWLLLMGASSLAFFGESALQEGGKALVLTAAWFKLDRIAFVFMELDEAPAPLRYAARAGLLALVLVFALILP